MTAQHVSREVDVPGGPTAVEIVGDGPEMLYLHGLSASPGIAADEAPRGRRLALPWQRGHGAFPWPAEESAYTLDGYVADAVAVLDALGWQKVQVGGTSMGAAVALRLALDHPDRVSQLFLAGPALADRPNPDAAILVEMAGFLVGADMDACIERIIEWQRIRGVPSEMSEVARRLTIHRPEPLATALRVVPRWIVFDGDADLRRLPSTHVVGWPEDPLHPLDLARRVAAVTGGTFGLAPGLTAVVTDPASVARAWAADSPA